MSKVLRRAIKRFPALLVAGPVLALMICGCMMLSIVDAAMAAGSLVTTAQRR